MEPNVPPPEEDKILYDTLSNDKEVKQVTRVVPYFSKLQLSDVSLKVRSFGEDRLFSTNKFYRENIRRGLSFIHEERIGTSLCRRGLEKFFDLRVEYFDVLDGTVELEGTRISRVEKQLYGVIFEEVVRALNEGGKIVVYKTEKANGENAQISYNKKHDAWIVASKNVSMLLRNRDDIEAYRTAGENGKMDTRYSVASMIAESWFDWLSKTTKSEELKKEILGKTIVGEYCGHPDYQHLVTYKNVEIKFFAMVDLHGKRSCNPIDKTKEFFTKFGLPQVKMEARRSCSNVKELIEVLQELTKEVSQSTIEQDQEGSVLYFEGHREDKAEILSLCKIKTLEYRLYRKLREKLKTTIRKGNSIGDQLYKYKKEVEALCKGYNTPQPLAHYYDTAELAMNFVKENLDKTKDLRVTQRYLDFLNVILECKRNGALPSLDHFKKIMESGELSQDESDVDEEAYDEEGNVIKEEQKVEEDFKERIQDDGHARRVVVVIPSSASAIEVRNTIQEKIKNVHLESDWAAGKLITEHKSVTVLEKFPDLKDVGGLEKNTFFLVVGGGKEEATGEDILKPEYEKFVEEVRKALPNNSMILPVGDANRIAEEVELGFGKVRSL